jgi:hypothetical protein
VSWLDRGVSWFSKKKEAQSGLTGGCPPGDMRYLLAATGYCRQTRPVATARGPARSLSCNCIFFLAFKSTPRYKKSSKLPSLGAQGRTSNRC